MRVELHKVCKQFGRVQALRGVDLVVPSGCRVAIVGPNGSGKSTLMRILMGMLTYRGKAALDGLDPLADRRALAPRMAYVPQVAPNLAATVADVVTAVASLRGLPRGAVAGLATELGLDLDELRVRPFRHLSGGMRQKLLAALALASRADLLILDEPTASMDARSRQRFFELVQEQEQKPTVLLCSHRVEEISNLVDRAVLLEGGLSSWQGDAQELLASESLPSERLAGDVVLRLPKEAS